MKEQPFSQILREIIEQEGANVDLRPAILAKVEARHSVQRKSRIARSRMVIRLGLSLTLVLFVIGLLGTIPVVRAEVAMIIRQFGLTLIIPDPRSITAQPQTMHGSSRPSLSITQAQAQVPFKIQTPTWLPTGIKQQSVAVSTGRLDNGETLVTRNIVTLYFSVEGKPSGEAEMVLSMSDGHVPAYLVSKEASQNITIKGHPATYVHGSWNPYPQWDTTIDDSFLTWEDTGITYTIRASDLGLSREDLLRIAESVQ